MLYFTHQPLVDAALLFDVLHQLDPEIMGCHRIKKKEKRITPVSTHKLAHRSSGHRIAPVSTHKLAHRSSGHRITPVSTHKLAHRSSGHGSFSVNNKKLPKPQHARSLSTPTAAAVSSPPRRPHDVLRALLCVAQYHPRTTLVPLLCRRPPRAYGWDGLGDGLGG